MLKLKEFSKLPNIIFASGELSARAKVLLVYLTNKSNYFKSEESWFQVPLKLFCEDIGFCDHHVVGECRDELIKYGLIDYRRGGRGNASYYKINWDAIYNNLTDRHKIKKENNNQQKTDDMGNYIGQMVDGKFIPSENKKQYRKKETVIQNEDESIDTNPIVVDNVIPEEIPTPSPTIEIDPIRRQKIIDYFKPRTVRGSFKTFCSGNSSVYNLGIPLEEIEVVFNEVKTAF